MKTKSSAPLSKSGSSRRKFLEVVGAGTAALAIPLGGAMASAASPENPVVSTDRLVRELSAAAKISEDKARKVIDLLHVSKVPENLEAVKTILRNPQATNALGISQDAARKSLEIYEHLELSLDNIRLGIKIPKGFAGPAA